LAGLRHPSPQVIRLHCGRTCSICRRFCWRRLRIGDGRGWRAARLRGVDDLPRGEQRKHHSPDLTHAYRTLEAGPLEPNGVRMAGHDRGLRPTCPLRTVSPGTRISRPVLLHCGRVTQRRAQPARTAAHPTRGFDRPGDRRRAPATGLSLAQ
jgi:hypothetical protein